MCGNPHIFRAGAILLLLFLGSQPIRAIRFDDFPRSELDSIFIDRVHLEKLEMPTVVDFLTEKMKELDPDHSGIKFILRLPGKSDPKTLPFRPEISLDLRDVSVRDLLASICIQANLMYRVEADDVVFLPVPVEAKDTSAEQPIIENFPPPPTLQGADTARGKQTLARLNSIIIDKINCDIDITGATHFLTDKSKDEDPDHIGVFFQLNLPPDWKPRTGRRDVILILEKAPLREVLVNVCAQTGLSYEIAGQVVVVTDVPPPAEQVAIAAIEKKMKETILPTVDWDDTDVATAIAFLNRKSRELDPAHQGIKITLRLPAPGSENSASVRRQVKMDLQGAPLYDILLYVVEQTNLEFRIEPTGVIVEPSRPEY
jgi:hypothetical protein